MAARGLTAGAKGRLIAVIGDEVGPFFQFPMIFHFAKFVPTLFRIRALGFCLEESEKSIPSDRRTS